MAPPGAPAASVDVEVMNVITLRNQIESPLLRLPGELRNRIWEYVFTVDYIYCFFGNVFKVCTIQENGRTFYQKIGSFTEFRDTPKACRQIYAETSTMVFKVNVLKVKIRDLRRAIDTLPERFRAGVRTIHIKIVKDVLPPEPELNETLQALEKLPGLTKVITPSTDLKALIEEHVGLDVSVVMAPARVMAPVGLMVPTRVVTAQEIAALRRMVQRPKRS